MLGNNRSTKNAILFFVCLLMLLPFSYNCIEKPLDPKAPSWTTQLTVPLLNRTYYFADIIGKDTKFDTTGGTILYKPSADEIGFRQGIPGSVFQMPSPKGNTINQEMGAVPVVLSVPPTVNVSASQLGLTPGTIPALTPDPPPITVNQTFGDSTSYKWLIYESGQMRLSVTNNFQFAIQFVGNTVQLVNLDDTTQIVGNFTFSGSIASGATVQSNIVQLTGVRMYSGLKMKTAVQIIGWAGRTIAAGNNISAVLGLSNALISSALVNTLNFSGTDVVSVTDSALQLDDSIKVKVAKFDSGSVRIRILNTAALSLTVEFKIPELITIATGQPYQLPGTNPVTGFVTIPPKDSLVTIINLSTQNFVSRERSAGDTLVTQYLHFSLGMKTLSAGGGFSQVNSTDYVVADVQPVQAFVLREVQGKVPPQSIAINQTIDAGIGDIGNKLTLTAFTSNIQLTAQILSTGLFPTNLVVRVYALDKDGNRGQSVLIRKPTDDPSFHRIVPGILDIVPIPSSDINLLMNSFLATRNELPSKFLLEGYALVSPLDVYNNPSPQFGIGIGGVKRTDSIFVSLDYAIPVQIGIQGASLKDTSSISANLDTAQVNQVEEGKIFFDLISTFPAGIEVRSKLLKPNPADSSKAHPTAPPVLVLDTMSIDGSPDHSNKSSFTFISLSGEDASKINQAGFAALDLRFATSNGSTPVTFRRNDSIVVRSSANIKFNVDIDKLTNE